MFTRLLRNVCGRPEGD